MFLSTEIFSKRRKIYAWNEEKPELPARRDTEVLQPSTKSNFWCARFQRNFRATTTQYRGRHLQMDSGNRNAFPHLHGERMANLYIIRKLVSSTCCWFVPHVSTSTSFQINDSKWKFVAAAQPESKREVMRERLFGVLTDRIIQFYMQLYQSTSCVLCTWNTRKGEVCFMSVQK